MTKSCTGTNNKLFVMQIDLRNNIYISSENGMFFNFRSSCAFCRRETCHEVVRLKIEVE